MSPKPQSPGSETCPVDHRARQAWLDQAARSKHATTEATTHFSLDHSRVVSSIPRLVTSPDDKPSSPITTTHGSPSPNAESDPHTAENGNWIYPSERMFFDAMKRKNHSPHGPDMRSVVPIHNAVNERAWQEILRWERPHTTRTKCAEGPKLVSFAGQATSLTPKARFNRLLGYAAPFDRHDWVLDRCGTRIDYVIDFYAGKPLQDGGDNKPLSFYLDVRPKLNTWEGCRTRAAALFGL